MRWDGCGGSSGQQASGQIGELELADGAFATRGRAPDAKPFWGNFKTDMAAVWLYPTTPHYQTYLGLPPSVYL